MKDFQLRNDTKLLFRNDPADLNARGVILYGVSLSTFGRLGLGKADSYAYDIYELEFRKCCTALLTGKVSPHCFPDS